MRVKGSQPQALEVLSSPFAWRYLGDDAEEEFEGILGIAHVLAGPEVGVVDDAAVLVFANGLAFHDPFEGGFAADDVGVAFFGDVADREVSVDGFVGRGIGGLGESHLLRAATLGRSLSIHPHPQVDDLDSVGDTVFCRSAVARLEFLQIEHGGGRDVGPQ